MPDLDVRQRVPLAPLTTMGVGGAARWFVEARDETTVAAAVAWAQARQLSTRVLGGGSNVVIADTGVDALVLRIALRGIEARESPDGVDLTAAAGEVWDDLVGMTVARGWAGFECLSGIPGLVGATPIQNVGAYGQEVGETVTAVRAFDTRSAHILTFTTGDCRFAYRDSLFKSGETGRYVVLAVTYRLRPGAPPTIRYADVERELATRGLARPSLADVRAAIIAIRRSKSMVIDADDPNHRSCGSFFVNPVVAADEFARVETRVGDPTMPRWPERDGRVKLSAAWLIEHAGFRRGHVEGAAGLSTRHALAIVARDGATAADIVTLADKIRAAVDSRFGVRLTPEPEFWAILPA
jgi:UDP-N-acetylmuramate dehydrogenase